MSDEETVEVYTHVEPVGARLRRAREDRKIEITDIARWLKLDVKTIAAIEKDDAENLPQPVYTVGYLRSYAKLVELSPDKIATDYLQTHQTAEVSVPEYRKDVGSGHLTKITDVFSIFRHTDLSRLVSL